MSSSRRKKTARTKSVTTSRGTGKKKAGKRAATAKAAARKSPSGKKAAVAAVAVKGAAPSTDGKRPAKTPFERFVLEFITARGGTVEVLGDRDYRTNFDSRLAKKLRRKSIRMIFDLDRATLPRGGVFAAPGSRFGLALLAAARGDGNVSRSQLPANPSVDAKKIARQGYVLHDVEALAPKMGKMRWVCQVIYHLTLTLRGGVAEQDLRSVLADPRGPIFEFLESEDRRRWQIEPGFPDDQVSWGETDVSQEVPAEEARALWSSLLEWLNRVQISRLERWRRRCDENRDVDLERINAYYEARLEEETERRRRRRDDLEDEDGASESQLKLEWSQRVKAVRARWQPQASVRLWGIEELARPRIPVMWDLKTPDGSAVLSSEIDLADGALTRLPCPVCGRLAGEFWWHHQLVCRRCRGRAAPADDGPGPGGRVGGRSGKGLRRPRRKS